MCDRLSPMSEPDWKAELLEDRTTSLATGGAPPPPTQGLRAAGVAAAMLAVAVIVLYAPNAARRPAASANPGPTAFAAFPTSLPTATALPTPTSDGGPCVTSPLEVTPPADTALPGWYRVPKIPETGLAAFTVDETRDRGSIVVAGAGADGPASARVAATYSSPGAPDRPEVALVGWSASGDTLLMVAFQFGRSSWNEGCSNLFLVNADGSGVTALTDNGPGGFIFDSALAPTTGRVAYSSNDGLSVIDPLIGDTHFARCSAPWTPRWSPDEQRLSAFCSDRRLQIVDLAGGTSIDYQLPAGLTLTGATWAGDSSSMIVVATEAGPTEHPPLAILDFFPGTGAFERRPLDIPAAASLSFASISPDGRWIVLQDWSDLIDVAVLSLETGATTGLPIPPAPDVDGPTPFAWFPDGDTALFGLGGVLYTVNVATTELVEVGLLPSSQFLWHNSEP